MSSLKIEWKVEHGAAPDAGQKRLLLVRAVAMSNAGRDEQRQDKK